MARRQSFSERLNTAWNLHNSLLCVGLDPDLSKLPESLLREAHPVFEFNKAIIDATADLACAFKPQIAYYAAMGKESALERTIRYIRSRYPDHLILLDSKRGDIGSTAEQYAGESFVRYDADAVTVSPYLGSDTVEPFLQWKDGDGIGRGVIVLCRTSNPGSGEIQNLHVNGRPVYQLIAERYAQYWKTSKNICLVAGATYPEELSSIRSIVGDMPLLVPGIGAQGGDIETTIKAGKDSNGKGMIINCSRNILYASNGKDFADAARKEARRVMEEVNRWR